MVDTAMQVNTAHMTTAAAGATTLRSPHQQTATVAAMSNAVRPMLLMTVTHPPPDEAATGPS